MADLELLDKSIRRVPDFPKPGILFYDITSVFVNPEAFKYCIDKMVDILEDDDDVQNVYTNMKPEEAE